jgi:perosamine synthetase
MPMYAAAAAADMGAFPVAENIAARGISLPSFPSMTDEMVDRVCATLVEALELESRFGA